MRCLPELHPERRIYSYVERGFYAKQLDRILRFVAPKQLLCLSSTELAAQPAVTLSKIAHFLGIEPFPCAEPRRIFVGSAVPNEDLTERDINYLRTIFLEDTRRFSAMSGVDTRDWLVSNCEVP